MQFHKAHCETPGVVNELSEENTSARICSSNLFSRSVFCAPVTLCIRQPKMRLPYVVWAQKSSATSAFSILPKKVSTDNDIIVCPDNQFPSGPVHRHMNTTVRCLFQHTLSLNHKPCLHSLASTVASRVSRQGSLAVPACLTSGLIGASILIVHLSESQNYTPKTGNPTSHIRPSWSDPSFIPRSRLHRSFFLW